MILSAPLNADALPGPTPEVAATICSQQISGLTAVAGITALTSALSGLIGIGVLFTRRKKLGAGMLVGGALGYFVATPLIAGTAMTKYANCRISLKPKALLPKV